MEGLDALSQNKLAMQYLAGLGADLSAYGANTDKGFQPANVNAITNQAITAQNSAKQQSQFMQMLKEAFNPDTTSELKAGPKGLTMSLDPNSDMMKNILSGPGSNSEDFYKGIGATGDNIPAPTAVTPTPPPGGTTPNPFDFGQYNPSASDLAGLTPEIMANNLSGALNVVGMQQKLGMERDYKSKLMDNIESEIAARVAKTNQENILDKPYPITLPSGEVVTNRQWSSLPDKTKQESTFFHLGRQKGMDEEAITKAWKSSNETEKTKFIREALADPKVMEAEVKLRKSGAINLGAELEKKRAMSGVDRENDILKPSFYQSIEKDLSTRLRTEWKMPGEASVLAKRHNITEEQATKAIQQSLVRREMDAQIKQVYPAATWIKGQGWIVDGKVVVRDPYAK